MSADTHAFDRRIMRLLAAAGLGGGRVLRTELPADEGGSASFSYERDAVRVRVDRDRGEEALFVGSAADPGQYYLLSDIGAALGWWTTRAAAAHPGRTIAEQIEMIATNWTAVTTLMSTPSRELNQRLTQLARNRAKLEFGLD